jgi:hypothetical protein
MRKQVGRGKGISEGMAVGFFNRKMTGFELLVEIFSVGVFIVTVVRACRGSKMMG